MLNVMATHLALLRGINVGGHHKLPMAQLREVVAGLGHTEIATYIQSGNVVFTPGRPRSPAELGGILRDAIAQACDFAPVVVVHTAQGWADLVAADPYPADAEPKNVHLAVQQEPVTGEQRQVLDRLLAEHQDAGGPDHLSVLGCTTYLHTPDGMGRSRLAERLARARGAGQDQATARNRASAAKLLEMLRS